MADHIDIPIDQYSDITYQFQAFHPDNTPVDITAVTDIVLTAKSSLSDILPIFQYSLADHISVVDGPAGLWQVAFPSANTVLYPGHPMTYDMMLVFGQTRYRACQGSILPDKNVTGV